MPAPAADPKTVLVVEDDPWIQTFMRDTLADEGYTVVQALDGQAGLRLAARQHPDVILLDLALPKRSGVEVLHQLKRRQPTRAIRVIVVSSYAHQVDDLAPRSVTARARASGERRAPLTPDAAGGPGCQRLARRTVRGPALERACCREGRSHAFDARLSTP